MVNSYKVYKVKYNSFPLTEAAAQSQSNIVKSIDDNWLSFITRHRGKIKSKHKAYAATWNASFVENGLWHFELEYARTTRPIDFEWDEDLDQKIVRRLKVTYNSTTKITAQVPDLALHNLHLRQKNILDSWKSLRQKNKTFISSKFVLLASKPYSYKLVILLSLLEQKIKTGKFKRMNYNANTKTLVMEFSTCLFTENYLDSIINVMEL